MSWIVFDCPSGISGDMTLGALVDLGVPLEDIRATLQTLPLHGWQLRAERVLRNSIAATHVHVDVDDAAHHHHRALADVLAVLEAGKLPPRSLAWATQVFQRLAAAEARVHHVPVEAIHFHEVGAVDAILDVAGACIGLEWLCARHDVQHLRVSQLRVGRGQVRTEHGAMPVPPPAVLELLADFPIQWGDADGERVTPTGAAILAALASPLADVPVRVRATGYGAGAREFSDTPNLLRVLLVEPVMARQTALGASPAADPAPHVHRGRVAVLSTTIDDMIPEHYGPLLERLLADGALDVFYTPVQMKKSRPATLVTVVARPEDAQRLATAVLRETTTLGVRIAHEERFELERRAASVQTPYGEVQVKVAVRPDGMPRVVPEHESVRRAAERSGVPLEDVYRAALRAAVENGPA
jgi:hypothetical protein